MTTYDIWIERRDGSRAPYRVTAEKSQDATREALRLHAAKTGDPIDGESCWIRQILSVADLSETQRAT